MRGDTVNAEFKRANTIDGIVIINCKVCNKTNYKYNPSLGIYYCSWPCYETQKRNNTIPNCECVVCHKKLYIKPSKLEIVKDKQGITCSRKCSAINRQAYMKGEGNHQFGLKGSLNASFVGEERLNQYGYVMLYLPNHPKADKDGRYRKHRYVIEQSNKYSDEYFDIIYNQRVLKDCYDSHHIDENKLNNNIDNLEIKTRSEHTTLHNNSKIIVRDELGRIIGVVKKGELSESLAEDNTEPSVTNEHNSSNEGAEHSS